VEAPRRSIVLCIVVEPEPRRTALSAPASDWDGFLRCLESLACRRRELAERTGAPVHFSWFWRLDPQVEASYGSAGWPLDRFRSEIKELSRHGDEHGVHPHFWRLSEEGVWSCGQEDQAWVERCIRMSHDAFLAHFGRQPVSVRFGDRWLNNETVALLDSLGYRYELSVEPGKRAANTLDTGPLPDYRRVPREPFRPSIRDFRRRGAAASRKLWMLPVTTGCTRAPGRRHLLHFRHPDEALNLVLWPKFVAGLVESALSRGGQTIVVPVLRTGDLLRERGAANFPVNLERLMAHPNLPQYCFRTPGEAIEAAQVRT
jgi:hypothetical protein